jgi:hypothetical protein
MRHWKLYVPGELGAVTLKVKVACPPGATDAGRPTRATPHVPLSCGFCEPRRCWSAAVQVFVPELYIVTETVYCCPAVIALGADCETKVAPLTGVGFVTVAVVELTELQTPPLSRTCSVTL